MGFLPCFWKLDFGVLPVRGVDDGRAADFGNTFSVSVKAPATNLVRPDHILDKLERKWSDTECVTDLGKRSEMIIFGSF